MTTVTIKQLHQELIDQVKKHQRKGAAKSTWISSYVGTPHQLYNINSKSRDVIVRQFLKDHHDLSFSDWNNLLDSLYFGKSFEERVLAGQFLLKIPELRTNLDLKQFDRWLRQLEGWAEVDTTCQSTFHAEELLVRWAEWDHFLEKLSQDKNISLRRASLVLLVKSTREVKDQRLADRAFANIDQLRSEKDILITKAVSWLLRSMVNNYKQQVAKYIEDNKDQLPAIAYRESKRKIETGRK